MGLKMKVNAAVVAIVLVFLLFPAVSYASTDDQKALGGLKGVFVEVGHIRAEIEPLGLTAGQIKTDVELRLRKAGIRVLTQEEWDKTSDKPYLFVNVTAYVTSNICIFSVQVGLNERVMLVRGFQVDGKIWEAGHVGTVRRQNVKTIRNTISDVVDQFINDYLAANPK